jgi:adenine-specific DNA-methyltransferase
MGNDRPSVHLQWNYIVDEKKVKTGDTIREIEKIIVNPVFDNQASFEQLGEPVTMDRDIINRYYCGDNYDLLQVLADNNQERKIDLIYIDPPYMTELTYHSRISIGNYSESRHINRKAFQDTWEDGLDSYLNMLYPRLLLMRRVLAQNGSIFVHVD